MDDEGKGQGGVGRRIALRFSAYAEFFARLHQAETWEQFAVDDPLSWRFIFLEIVDDPATLVFFNLRLVDVAAGLTRVASGPGTTTDWELLQIYEHASWWPRVQWWDEGVQVSNPWNRGLEP